MIDNLLWFVHLSHNGSSQSFISSKTLVASIFGSSSTSEPSLHWLVEHFVLTLHTW
jgi:hypothetical protein